jgi:hypothetical protein
LERMRRAFLLADVCMSCDYSLLGRTRYLHVGGQMGYGSPFESDPGAVSLTTPGFFRIQAYQPCGFRMMGAIRGCWRALLFLHGLFYFSTLAAPMLILPAMLVTEAS